MKKWTNPEFITLDINETENGRLPHKYEGIDGVDASGSDNSRINKNGSIPWPGTDNPS